MAFQQFNARNMPPVGDQPGDQQQPTQLSLELVPPALCQSFGLPMHDACFGAFSAPQYPLQQRTVPQQQAQFGYTVPQQQAQFGYGYGMGAYGNPMGGYGNPMGGYGMPTAMAPYHPQQFQQAQFQQAYNRGAWNGQYLPESTGPMGGYDMLQQQQQHAHHQQQQMAAEPALECKGLKRSLSGMQQQGEGSGTLGGGHSRQEAVALKRSRLVWTPELHLRFREAVDRAGGIEAAVPKVVLELMGVDGLTRDNVASHLQKHRIHLKKARCDAAQTTGTSSLPDGAGAPAVTSARTPKAVHATTSARTTPDPSSAAGDTRNCGSTTRVGHHTDKDAHCRAALDDARARTSSADQPPQGQGDSSSGNGTCGSGNTVVGTSGHAVPTPVPTPHSRLPGVGHTGDTADAVPCGGASKKQHARGSSAQQQHVLVSNGSGGASNFTGSDGGVHGEAPHRDDRGTSGNNSGQSASAAVQAD